MSIYGSVLNSYVFICLHIPISLYKSDNHIVLVWIQYQTLVALSKSVGLVWVDKPILSPIHTLFQLTGFPIQINYLIIYPKGQLISKNLFGVFNSSKKWTWKFKFLPLPTGADLFHLFFGRIDKNKMSFRS